MKRRMLVLAACSPRVRHPAEHSEIGKLLDGFQFYDALDHHQNVVSLPLTPESAQDLKPAHTYRFRHQTGGVVEQELGCKVLPERLRLLGFRVTKQPCSGFGFIHVDPGGTLFDVIGVRNGCELTLAQSHIVPQPWWWRYEESGHWEEAVLLLSPAR